jgi:hypothetical protein
LRLAKPLFYDMMYKIFVTERNEPVAVY